MFGTTPPSPVAVRGAAEPLRNSATARPIIKHRQGALAGPPSDISQIRAADGPFRQAGSLMAHFLTGPEGPR